ncbi:MAG: uroporphyrinogen-III synthase [Ilumatobacter sp.]|nr:uroporphyrinogen-III synthase [Ilumatobacter sp.]
MHLRPLAHRRVVTTRDHRGRLDSQLASAGADVVHVPLIEIVPALGGDDLDLSPFDWVVVTSRHGASAVGRAAANAPRVRLAAVGSRTAARLAELAGRSVEVVPNRQTAADLVEAMPPGPAAVLVAQADRADPTLVDGLQRRGYAVESVTAYRTVTRTPTAEERHAALHADAVTFASGSAAEGWVEAIGQRSPSIVVAIGPVTAAVASAAGLQITHVAADHSIEGLVDTVITALSTRS